MYENPSADKFGPPPDSSLSKPVRKYPSRVWRYAVIPLIYAGAGLLAAGGRGWPRWLSAVVLIASFALDTFFRQHPSEDEGPYSPPTNVTH
jgi:hypothetical protein